MHELAATCVLRAAHLARGRYNVIVSALHGPIGQDLGLCAENLLARLAGWEPVV